MRLKFLLSTTEKKMQIYFTIILHYVQRYPVSLGLHEHTSTPGYRLIIWHVWNMTVLGPFTVCDLKLAILRQQFRLVKM